MTPEERARRLIDHCDNKLHGYYPVATVALAIHDALTEAAPKWTKESPTVPGWYWWRAKDKAPRPIQVEFTYGYLRCRGCRLDNWRFGGEWAGPLTPPEADHADPARTD